LNTERAKIPGQTTTLNNAASNNGITNAQKIRNSLNQMGLLQSGESATQQLLNDTTVANNTNANNLKGQELDMGYGNQIATAQTELATKVKQINDAISLAQAQGDENSLLVLKDAQAKIANATATSAVDYNKYAYTAGRDAVSDRMTQQEIDARNVQNALDNVYRQNEADTKNRQWQDQFTQSNAQFDKNYALNQQELAASIANQAASRAASAAKSSTTKPTVGQLGDAATADAIEAIQSSAPKLTRSEFNTGISNLKSSWIRDGADLKVIQEIIDNVKTRDEIEQEQVAEEATTNSQAWADLPLWERLKRGTMFN
jgi:hypothetical protein